MKIEVSNGEILDKLSILELKLQFMEDESQKANVQKEYDLLKTVSTKILFTNDKTFPEDFYRELSNVNLKLWSIEHKFSQGMGLKCNPDTTGFSIPPDQRYRFKRWLFMAKLELGLLIERDWEDSLNSV